MTILNILFSATALFFTMSTLLVFLHCFHDTRYTWTVKKGLMILAFATLQSASTVLWSPYISFLFIPIECFVITYQYSGNRIVGYLRYLPFDLSFTLGTMMISFIGSYLIFPGSLVEFLGIEPLLDFSFEEFMSMSDAQFSAIMKQWESSVINNFSETTLFLFTNILLTIFFGFLFFYLYFRLYRRGTVIQTKLRERLLLILYPVFCFILLMVIIFIEKESSTMLVLLTGMSILLALLIPVFFYSMRISQHYRERTVIQENYMQAELEHFTQYKLAQEETSRFRHDIRNNLLCINDMLQSGKTEDATQYLQELLNTTQGLRQKYVSGDEMLDCIIGVKDGIMAEKRIRFQLSGVLAGGLSWKPMDICVVFANALDNAIEACQQLSEEDRYIHMTIRNTEQYWFVTLENPVKEPVDTSRLFQKAGGYTSKPNTKQHGMGTYNMLRTAESYGGILKATCEDLTFRLEIMIDKSRTETTVC